MPYTRQIIVNDDTLYHPETVVSEWYNTRFTALGDSIVATGEAMFDIMRDRLGFSSYRNSGVSGRSMTEGTANGAGTSSTARGLTYEGDTMVYIAAGTNDFKLDAPLGEIGSAADTIHNDNTFYGAYRAALDYILTSSPQVDIYLATPLQRDKDGYNTESVNGAGHMLIDYRNAIIEIGEMYSVPVIDMYAHSGISTRTLSSYTGDGLHPNSAGLERMARVAVTQIRSHTGAIRSTRAPEATTWEEVTEKPTTFPPTSHTHTTAEVSGLQPALDGKAPTTHTHTWAQVTGKPTTFAPAAHSHTVAQVTGLQTTLNGLVTGTNVSSIWAGTQAQYDALTPDPDTLYVIREN